MEVKRNKIKKILDTFLTLFKNPVQIFNDIKSNNVEAKPFFIRIILPFIVICSVFSVINLALYGTNVTIPKLCVRFLFEFIAFVAAFFISVLVCQKTVSRLYQKDESKSVVYQVVGVGFVVMYLLNILLSVVNLFFLWILAFYVVYLLWIAAGAVFEIDENHRGKFLFFNSISILFSELLIFKLLACLVPNLSL
ncbi:MAG: DUF1282 domain-containing protein [Sphingobacteriia bacterium]|jgi:phosphatidylglycerophosphatase A|nr:hypothetical protein [Paludibacteraceae bacterium]NCA79158.1 DUF1282 domain-containing protein [Sphingobacteriia bacterium]